jgi:hypothetical protein
VCLCELVCVSAFSTRLVCSPLSPIIVVCPPLSTVPPCSSPHLPTHCLQLCKDDTPMVRRAASQNLGDFAQHLALPEIMADLLPVVIRLSGDDQDSVRLLSVESCIKLCAVVTPAVKSTNVSAAVDVLCVW